MDDKIREAYESEMRRIHGWIPDCDESGKYRKPKWAQQLVGFSMGYQAALSQPSVGVDELTELLNEATWHDGDPSINQAQAILARYNVTERK